MAAWVVTFSFELYKAQCMDVKERNYRWSESRSKMCQLLCDMGEDESVEHVVLECEKYERDRQDGDDASDSE